MSDCFWGIKEVVIIAQLCHSYCLTCNGPLNTQCYTCVSTYFLSGNTCSTACLTGYGQVTASKICVLCDLKCITCAGTATNCSSCTASGADAAYLSGNTCVLSCPSTTFGNNTTRTCNSCPSNCNNCTSSTVCTTCTSPYLLLSTSCVSSCPGGTFTGTGVCTSCDSKCLSCTGALDTQCQSCATGYTLSGSTCAASCLPTYGPSSTPKICLSCMAYCLSCNLVSTNCSSCVTSGSN